MIDKIPKQIVIIGGGSSIKEGLTKDLWKKLENKFIIGLNYSYNYFKDPTIQCYVDRDFYKDNIEKMSHLPLIIGNTHKGLKLDPNTITINTCAEYKRDLNPGCYKASLGGLFALSLAIYLLDGGTIFLLGYDWGGKRKIASDKPLMTKFDIQNAYIRDKQGRKLTHFYQGEIKHRGIGKTNYFENYKQARKDFKPYKAEKKCKIYNVSPDSQIPSDIFPKINYDEFLKMLDTETYDQSLIRQRILNKLERRAK